ncbi:DUF481 domain-containing protein [Pseudogemmobacter hezensis]|uniref:DUF481 domain-containing protein n=1 Tax=Pseudogemmobacter hezensis TaxID=2737662 RepID=UPI0020A65FB3|nr:DUF481 domain-containing protein [Pseudogemmobacter hezensis]
MNRARDEFRFGSPDQRQGLSGSASLGFSGKTGNNESQELAIGLRIRHAAGPFVQTIGAVLDYAESNNRSTKKDVFAIYDANYYFNDKVYGFILGRVQSDGKADELSADQIAAGNTLRDNVKRDAFLGFGPGYRVVNTDDVAWRVQAGIGISYLQYGDDSSVTEETGIVSSRLFYKINDNVFLTNDTDVLKSDTALRANNDFGVNFKISDAMSTRVSYLTEYNESRAIRTDNKLGVSIVFGF